MTNKQAILIALSVILTSLFLSLNLVVYRWKKPVNYCEINYCYVGIESKLETEKTNEVDRTELDVASAYSAEMLYAEFGEFGKEVADWAVRVAFCESGLNPDAYDAKFDCKGLFQFLPSTFRAYGSGDIWLPRNQVEAVKAMIRILGWPAVTKHWEGSRGCWGK